MALFSVIKWPWNQPEVSIVLGGMSTMEHVVQNVESASRSGPGTMTDEELDLIAQVREAFEVLCPMPCTDCKYCLPCPSGVNIPGVFEIYNDMLMNGDDERAQMVYHAFMKEDERADRCTECGECLEVSSEHRDPRLAGQGA